MNLLTKTVAAGLVCAFVGFGTAQTPPATAPASDHQPHAPHQPAAMHHPEGAEPGFFHEELDNRQVRVLRINIPAHAQVPMHDVTPRVVIWLTEAHLKMTFPDGTTREESHHPGEVGWTASARHFGENLGAEPIEFVAVIPKGAAESGSLHPGH